MSYFGGLGSGKGWLKFLFLVESQVLGEILSSLSSVYLVYTAGRVPIAYKMTSLDEYLRDYQRYLDGMLDSEASAKTATGAIRISLATSLEYFTASPCPDTRYKVLNSVEPLISIAPLTLCYDDLRGRLLTNVMTDLYFGVELSFPKVISLTSEKHEILHDTSKSATCSMYLELKSRISKMTETCRIRSPTREHRSAIRFTKTMRERMRSHPGFRRTGLEIV